MSGWIKVEKAVLSDIRFKRMVREWCNDGALHESTAVTQLLGALTQLWLYADEHIRDDDTMRGTVDDINGFVGLQNFCQLLPPDWFVVVDADNVQLPDWLAHNGSLAKKRAMTQLRVAKHRTKANGNAPSLHIATHGNAHALPDQTRPDQTIQDQTKQKKEGMQGESSAARSTRIPPMFGMTPERRAYAEAQGLNALAVMEAFVDYWTAASGAKARKNDWDATWRTWCRNQFEQPGTKKPYKEPRSAAEILAEEEHEQRTANGV